MDDGGMTGWREEGDERVEAEAGVRMARARPEGGVSRRPAPSGPNVSSPQHVEVRSRNVIGSAAALRSFVLRPLSHFLCRPFAHPSVRLPRRSSLKVAVLQVPVLERETFLLPLAPFLVVEVNVRSLRRKEMQTV